jgi:4-carboxymuconolactone decarboxylase
MDERSAYLAQMRAQRGYILDFHQILAAEDLPFMRALNELMNVASMRQRTLEDKTKELVYIGTLVGLGAAKEHIRNHMEKAKRCGATKREVLEVLELTVNPCGVPKFLVGFEVWKELFEVERVEPNPET